MRLRFLFAIFVAATVPCVLAAEVTAPGGVHRDTHFTIDLPQGYLPPVEHVSGTGVSRGFRKPYPGSNFSTVILITVQEMGPTFARRVPKERMELTLETVEPVIESIARNRTGFRKGEPREVTIAGEKGVRIAWTGSAQGVSFEGAVFCVLTGARAYAIQVQDPTGLGNARLNEAIQAVERMRFVR